MRILLILCMMLLVLQVYAGTFRDDFEDGNLDGWIISNPWNVNSSWTINNGKLIAISEHVDGWDVHLILGISSLWKDYEVSVNSKIVKCFSRNLCATGLLLRRASLRQYVQLAVLHDFVQTGPCLQFYEMDNNVWEEKFVNPFEVNLDTWYNIKVSARKDEFNCYVDDKLVLNHKFLKFKSGAVGLAINGAEVHFDDFSVTGEDVPDNIKSVEFKSKLPITWGDIRRAK